MARRDGDTLSLEDSSVDAPLPATGSLIVALEYQRPSAGSVAYSLDGIDEVVLGRGAERSAERTRRGGLDVLTVRIPDRWMSREHVKLVRFSGHFRAIDLQSKNGMMVQGAACDRATLDESSLLEVGQTAFFVRPEAVPLVQAAPPLECPTYHHALSNALAELSRLAESDVPVLLLGETGTGKEVLARALHTASRRKGALVAVNCAALPRTLLETELFGHRRGAFSGADADRVGLVRSADGGTLFLDEVGELSESAQAALLRVLEEKVVVPVGDARPIRVNFRLLTATNRDLPSLVQAGTFRADLYARLRGVAVELPPLSARRADLGLLTAAILRRSTPHHEKVRLTPRAGRALLSHRWPHNVRELASALTTALALSDDLTLDLHHLKLEHASAPSGVPEAPPSEQELSGDDREARDRIVALLGSHQGNVAQVARALGKAPTQVYRWMQRYGIRPGPFRV